MDNRLRLGQFVTQRQGAHFEEKWIEGYRFKELDGFVILELPVLQVLQFKLTVF